MEQKNSFTQRDYERASRLLGDLFEVNSDIIEQICCHIQKNGIVSFFNTPNTFDFSPDIAEKLEAVGMVLYGMGEESLAVVQNFKEPKGGVIYERNL
ncbi:hypothetical protein [Dehalobacterium formicoaceticum]|uniref:hypothetical protein n=1 Tax=Dehalobacterium formicoaceticum TaxID=51515 RepID=UPI0031F6BE6D